VDEIHVPPVAKPAAEPIPAVRQAAVVYREILAAARKPEPIEAEPPPQARRSDVVLRFNVDRDTREVTVYVMDRASRQVLRTIPPDELNKLNAGDLIELLA
jgi:hypothetical protein